MTSPQDFHRVSRDLVAANDEYFQTSEIYPQISEIADIKVVVQLIQERVEDVIDLIGDRSYEGFTRAISLYDRAFEAEHDDNTIRNIRELVVIQIETILDLILMAEYRRKAEYEANLYKQKAKRLNEVNEALHRKGKIDPLTELYNKDALKKEGKAIFELCKEKKAPLSCLFIDIDYFKPINDNYGHETGDIVLRRFAEIIREEFRGSDVAFGKKVDKSGVILGRDGGEEFVVLMPYTALEDAAIAAERFRKRIQNERINIIKRNEETRTINLSLTCTIGVAQTNFKKDKRVEDVKGYADEAVKFGKKQHRNIVSVVTIPENQGVSIKYPFIDDPNRRVIEDVPRYADHNE